MAGHHGPVAMRQWNGGDSRIANGLPAACQITSLIIKKDIFESRFDGGISGPLPDGLPPFGSTVPHLAGGPSAASAHSGNSFHRTTSATAEC